MEQLGLQLLGLRNLRALEPELCHERSHHSEKPAFHNEE